MNLIFCSLCNVMFLLLGINALAQGPTYFCDENGSILRKNQNGTLVSLGNFGFCNDIAISSSGDLYTISDRVYFIDTINQVAVGLTPPLNQTSVGLCATIDGKLLFDQADTLYSFTISSNQIEPVGYMGYFCSGDFCFHNTDLYMISELNEIIKIEYDPYTNSISNIQNLGVANTPVMYVLGITSDGPMCDESKNNLLLFELGNCYKLDMSNWTVTLKEQVTSSSIYGAASLNELIIDFDKTYLPNVFTPNGDNINDLLIVEYHHMVILNRWGNIVFESTDGTKYWDGNDLYGNPCVDGVYFYSINDPNCKGKSVESFIQLTRN